ncbi:MAG: ABC transporter ATP-binding protein [Clostridia bacterium]
MSENTVKIEHLYKKYSASLPWAVEDLSMETIGGEIVGLLGQNGAGKTTTLKCITGMLPITQGSISVCGYNIKSDPKNAKQNFGYVTDNHAVFEKMTGLEYINFMADVYCVSTADRKSRIDEFQSSLNLGDAIYMEISGYSHGMKQKIAIMGALIHSPKVWILDEPMTGLDPQTSFEVRQLMQRHKEQGNTVLFSSHNLDVVERICDRAYIINKSNLIDSVDIAEFKKTSAQSLEEYFFDLIKEKQNESK